MTAPVPEALRPFLDEIAGLLAARWLAERESKEPQREAA